MRFYYPCKALPLLVVSRLASNLCGMLRQWCLYLLPQSDCVDVWETMHCSTPNICSTPAHPTDPPCLSDLAGLITLELWHPAGLFCHNRTALLPNDKIKMQTCWGSSHTVYAFSTGCTVCTTTKRPFASGGVQVASF